MIRIVICAIALLYFSQSAHAIEPRAINASLTADQLNSWCLATKSKPGSTEQGVAATRCLIFLEGVVKGVLWSAHASKRIFREMSSQAGQDGDKVMEEYFARMSDNADISIRALLACMPLDIETTQIADALLDYVKVNPGAKSRGWYEVIPAAIAKQYPCKKDRY